MNNLNWSRKTRTLLYLLLIGGILLFLPGRHGFRFHPRALIFVFFPAFTIAFSWIYVQLVSRGFRVIRREMPETSLEKEFVEVQLEVGYESALPFANAYLLDNFPAVDVFTSPEISLDHDDFARSGIAKITYRHQLNRGYGDFKIGPVEIRVEDPFGFFEKKLIFQVNSKLRVWLNPPPPDDLDLIKENALTPMGDTRSTLSGHGMDFFGIKEYVQGDDIRAMSWLKTAQTGKPIIKQFERDSRPDVLVVVHTDKTQLRGFGFGNTMKRLLRIVAAIMVETQKRGLQSALGINMDGLPQYLKIGRSIPIYGLMTDLLGGLEPAEEDGLRYMLDLAINKAGPGTIVMIMSQTVHLDLESLLHSMMTLQSRGAKVSLWAIDDSDMIRFSDDQKNVMTKEDFKQRLEEMDLKFVLLPAKKELDLL